MSLLRTLRRQLAEQNFGDYQDDPEYFQRLVTEIDDEELLFDAYDLFLDTTDQASSNFYDIVEIFE